MAAAGCPIQGSAIHRIETGKPRRTIAVDELVAFAKVFNVGVEELLTPMDLILDQRAKHLAKELDRATGLLVDTTVSIFNMYSEYLLLAAASPELKKYVDGHWNAAAKRESPVAALLDNEGQVTDDVRLSDLSAAYSRALMQLGRAFAEDLARLAGDVTIGLSREGQDA